MSHQLIDITLQNLTPTGYVYSKDSLKLTYRSLRTRSGNWNFITHYDTQWSDFFFGVGSGFSNSRHFSFKERCNDLARGGSKFFGEIELECDIPPIQILIKSATKY